MHRNWTCCWFPFRWSWSPVCVVVTEGSLSAAAALKSTLLSFWEIIKSCVQLVASRCAPFFNCRSSVESQATATRRKLKHWHDCWKCSAALLQRTKPSSSKKPVNNERKRSICRAQKRWPINKITANFLSLKAEENWSTGSFWPVLLWSSLRKSVWKLWFSARDVLNI